MIAACSHLPTVRRRCPHHERVHVRITGSKASVWTIPARHPCVCIFQTGRFPVSSHCESWLIVSLVNSFWIIYCSEKTHQMSQWLTYGNFKWPLDWLLFLPLGPETKNQTIYHLRPVEFFTVRSGPSTEEAQPCRSWQAVPQPHRHAGECIKSSSLWGC